MKESKINLLCLCLGTTLLGAEEQEIAWLSWQTHNAILKNGGINTIILISQQHLIVDY